MTLHRLNVPAIGVSTQGNTGGNTGTSQGTWVVVASNNITVSQSTGTDNIHSIYFSGGAGAAGNTGSISAGTTRGTLGEIVFSNSNGVSFGINGQTVTATVATNYLTSQSNQNVTAGNGGFAFETLSFSNVNGISFGTSAGSAITASHNALTSQSNQAFSAQGGSSAFQTLVFTNSNGISFSNTNGSVWASHNALTSQSNQALSAGNGSFTFQTATFADSNGVSFSTGTQGIYATVKTDYLTSQTNQTLGMYAVGNTTGESSSSTRDARTISFNGAGNVSVGYSAGSVVISGGTAAASPVNISAGTTSNNLGTVVFSNSNGVSFGLNGSTITASVAAGAADGVNIIAAGTQTANTTGTVIFSNSNGVTFGMSNSSVVTASVLAPYTASRWPLMPLPLAASAHINGTTTTTAGGSRTGITLHVAPFYVHEYVSFDNVKAQISFGSSAGTWSQTGGIMWGLYTDNAGTLSRMSTWMFGHVLSQSSATNYTQNWWWGTNSTSNSSQTSGNVSASFNKIANMLLHTGGSSITPGNYYIVCGASISSTGGSAGFSFYHVSQSLSTGGSMWGTNVSSVNDKFFGIHTLTVSSNAAHIMCLPDLISSNSISGTGGTSQLRYPVIYFGRTGA